MTTRIHPYLYLKGKDVSLSHLLAHAQQIHTYTHMRRLCVLKGLGKKICDL